MRIASVGRSVFAALLIVLGIAGLVTRDFVAPWQPVPNGVPAREVLSVVCAIASLGCGACLFARKTARWAARVLAMALVIWLLVFRASAVVRAPLSVLSWFGCAEPAVIASAAWVLSGDKGLRAARVVVGLALIVFGWAHFAYVAETAALVPSWLPAHAAFAVLTGGTFIAAAVAVIVGVRARLAATLSTVQIGAFTLLVWVPIVARGHASAFQWSELAVSSLLAAAAWVVAESYPRVGS